jgi:uncharacterized MnhB-related membrane protein
MRVFAVLIAATAIYVGAHDVALAQATVPAAAAVCYCGARGFSAGL